MSQGGYGPGLTASKRKIFQRKRKQSDI